MITNINEINSIINYHLSQETAYIITEMERGLSFDDAYNNWYMSLEDMMEIRFSILRN